MAIVVVGAGPFARELYGWHQLGGMSQKIKGFLTLDSFLKSNPDEQKKFAGLAPILGDEDSYKPSIDDEFIIAVGDVGLKRRIFTKLKEKNFKFGKWVHTSSIVVQNVDIGQGTIIGPMCMISNSAKIGDFVTINSSCVIGHDSVIGENSVISPLCGVMGYGEVAEDVFLGAQCVVAPKIKVGAGSKISSGCQVVRDVPQKSLVSGAFARIIPLME